MFENNFMTKRSKINFVPLMMPKVMHIGFSVLEEDGSIGSTGTETNKLKTTAEYSHY